MIKQKMLPGLIGQMRDAIDFERVKIEVRTKINGETVTATLDASVLLVNEAAEEWARSLGASSVTFVSIRGYNP